MCNPKVSVIIPVYNGYNYIPQCMDSILNQTLKEIEIIFINDGSTDSSLDLLKQYENLDERIKVLNQKNSGPSVARNRGMKCATGEYIGFIDIDDYIEKDMYEKLYDMANKLNTQICMCNYNEIYVEKMIKKVVNHSFPCNQVLDKTFIMDNIVPTFTENKVYVFYPVVNKIYLRKWILDTDIYMDEERDHGEDWWFNISLFLKVDKLSCVEDCLYNYVHINNNSLLFKYRENYFDLCLDGRIKLFQAIPNNLINYEELNKRFISEFSIYIIETFKNVSCRKKRNKLIGNVFNNIQVLNACKSYNKVPLYYKIPCLLINFGLIKISYVYYRLLSLIKK